MFRLSQERFASRVVKRLGMKTAIAHYTQMELNINWYKEPDVPYRETIGSYMYLADGSRPDVVYSVSTLANFAEKPCAVNRSGIKLILRYVKVSTSLGLDYFEDTAPESVTYVDSEWAGDLSNKESRSGMGVMMA